MCGIAGYWGKGNLEILNAMGDSLAHRGPDGHGVVINGPVGLAHRRLAVVDLSATGHQPMVSEDARISLVFNGELYDHRRLKSEYLHDHNFRGTSDTEVLLRLYEIYGESMLTKITGMFAFALYDERNGQLMLARDHLGKKPLYWTLHEGTLIFGSELKTLRMHPECPASIDSASLASYLVHEYVTGTRTIYEGINKLPPGSYLTYDGKEVIIRKFDTLVSAQGAFQGSVEDATEELRRLLVCAVEKRLEADVPVGVFLSGGLDSSTIAYIAQQSKTTRVKTFSIGFEDPDFDERSYAREVATTLGTEHRERIVTESDLISLIDSIPHVLDEPVADSSIIPTLLLSEFTRAEVTVALTGDGADEIFWGYDTFFAHSLGLLYEHVPMSLNRLATRGVSALPVSHGYMSFDFKLKKFLSGFDGTRAERNTLWLGAFLPYELDDILTFSFESESLFARERALYSNTNFWDALQHDYLSGYLLEDILVKADRASMAHGLEVRSPFLDLDVVRFALSLPKEHKLHGRTGKYIVRKLMEHHLPPVVTKRRKHGFNMPIGAWFRGNLKEYLSERLLSGELVSSGLFKQKGIAILLNEHAEGRIDHRKKLWTLLVLELWMKKWQ